MQIRSRGRAIAVMMFETRNNQLQSSMFEFIFPFGSWFERHRK